jgi:ATP synthase protein I
MPADGIDPPDPREGGQRPTDGPDGSPWRPRAGTDPEGELLRRGRERQNRFHLRIGRRAADRLRARREPDRTLFHALASSGMVGWSVVVPTLLGLAAGSWLDRRFPAPWSWSLTLMLSGLALGCWNAWQWIVSREDDHDDDGNP